MTGRQVALFAKTHRMLKTARLSLEDGDAESAINRTYYAAFHAAMAALLSVGEAPKTHSGTHHLFHLHFVKSGRLPVTLGETFRHAFTLRQRAGGIHRLRRSRYRRPYQRCRGFRWRCGGDAWTMTRLVEQELKRLGLT